ncbi:hypothetical protein AAG906_006636 [Vitis piasezkii]
MQNALRRNRDVFAWAHSDMKGIHPSITSHSLTSFPTARPIRQKIGWIHREVHYPDRLANVVVVPKKKESGEKCVDYTNLNNACPKDFPLPRIDQIMDSIGKDALFLGCLLQISSIPMSPPTRKNNIHNATRPLLLQSHAIRTQKCWRHLSETNDKDLQTSDRPHGRGIY